MPRNSPELESLSDTELIRLIFRNACSLGEIAKELHRRASITDDQATLVLSEALDLLSRLLRSGTPPQDLLAVLQPLARAQVHDPDLVN